MLTTRDLQVIDFISEYKVATTSTIAEVFFPSKIACYKRLQQIYNQNMVRRTRDFISQEYIYHVKKNPPQQVRHSLLVTDFYRELHKKADSIVSFKIEPILGDIRPDAIFGYIYKGKNYLGLLEVEISHKGFNFSKYEKFYNGQSYKTYLPVMPDVFVVGDNIKLSQASNIKYRMINTDFNNFTL
jgi:predicted transcriptional regulator